MLDLPILEKQSWLNVIQSSQLMDWDHLDTQFCIQGDSGAKVCRWKAPWVIPGLDSVIIKYGKKVTIQGCIKLDRRLPYSHGSLMT
jgi:hypothetical protein